MNYARITAALVAAIGLTGLGFKLGMELKQGQWDAAKVAEAEAKDKALKAAAEAIAQIEVKHQTIVQKVRHEVTKEPVYRDCVLPDAAVGLLNSAALGASAPTGGD